MSEEQKNNVPLIGEIFVEGEAPPQYYQAFLKAQAKAEEAAGRAEAAVGKIVVDQEFIETQVFSAGQASEIAAAAARDAQTAAGAAAQSEQNTKDDADRAAGAAGSAEAALQRTEEVADSVGSPVSYKPQTLSKGAKAQARKNIGADFSYFGYRYSESVATYDLLSNGSSVKMYLFPHNGGYAAVVSGKGDMENPDVKLHSKGLKVITEKREYAEYIPSIKKVCIEQGVTSVGDYFMHQAYNLKEVVFEDCSQIKYLGKFCFACTQISGEYEFSGLNNNLTLDRCFYCCPNLQGIALDSNATENKRINLSYRAFYGCIALKYFKLIDPLNTIVEFGLATFDCCGNLELFEVQPSNSIMMGFNFLKVPWGNVLVKYWKDVDKGAIGLYPAGSFSVNSWGYPDRNGDGIIDSKDRYPLNAFWLSTSSNMKKWQACLEVAKEYGDKAYELRTPECDYQSADAYFDNTNPSYCKGTFWRATSTQALRVSYYGACWLFAYMHIWNAIHPTQQFDTIEKFVDKLEESKITIDAELANILATKWNFITKVSEGVYNDADYFTEGRSIKITDLPVDMNNSDSLTTIGEKGDASWGVRTVLDWVGTRYTGDTTTNGWANVKRKCIDSIFEGKPVLFECVGAASSITPDRYAGAHAVAAIGYDAKKDMFKIVDSSTAFPTDTIPMVYWTTFEALLEPSEESAAWIFSSFDESATIKKAPDHWGDKIGDIGAALDAIIALQESLIRGDAV